MNMTQTFDNDSADDLLNEYVQNVSSMRDKTLRVACAQRAVCDTLRRTADALRRLAEATRH